MNVSEGLTRIARVIVGLGWIWMLGFAVAAAVHFLDPHRELSLCALLLMVGGFGLGASKAISWVIKGFASPSRT